MGWEGQGYQGLDNCSTSLRIFSLTTESITRQSLNNCCNSLLLQQLLDTLLQTLETLFTGYFPDFAERSTHPLSISIVVPRPHHHGNLHPEVRETLHTLFRVLHLGADISQQDVHLLRHGVHHGSTILACPLGRGCRDGESSKAGKEEL